MTSRVIALPCTDAPPQRNALEIPPTGHAEQDINSCCELQVHREDSSHSVQKLRLERATVSEPVPPSTATQMEDPV